MAHAQQGPLIVAPSAAVDADEAVVATLGLGDDGVRLPEGAQQRNGVDGGAVGEVAHVGAVGGGGVELGLHVALGELVKGARLEADAAHETVHLGQVDGGGAALVEQEVGKGAAAVGGRDGDEGSDAHTAGQRRQVRDEVAGVETAHAVGDDGDGLLAGADLGEDVGAQRGRALLNRRRGRHRRRDDGRALRREGSVDAVPVLHRGEERRERQLREAEKAVG